MKEANIIKGIALDLDGTLLHTDGTIGIRTMQALRQLVKRGYFVTLVTGRMYATAVPYGRQLQLGDIPIVLYNGGLIKTIETEKTLFEQTIDKSVAQALLQVAKEKQWQIQTYIQDTLHVAERCAWVQSYEKITKCKAIVEGKAFYQIQAEPTKMVCRGEHTILEARRNMIEALFPQTFTLVYSAPTFLEIIPKTINKGNGICRLSEIVGIKPENMVAFGDSPNDLDMFKAVGVSVAMGNAVACVKEEADYVTSTNDDDGIAQFIEDYILDKGDKNG